MKLKADFQGVVENIDNIRAELNNIIEAIRQCRVVREDYSELKESVIEQLTQIIKIFSETKRSLLVAELFVETLCAEGFLNRQDFLDG